MEGNSFRDFKEKFASLDPPEALEGVWQGEPVGPGWYLALAGPSLVIGGLGGWWGKDFDGQGGIDNVLERKGAFRRTLRGEVRRADSLVDGKPCQRIVYPGGLAAALDLGGGRAAPGGRGRAAGHDGVEYRLAAAPGLPLCAPRFG